jgi:hypothetical protein
MHKQDLSPLGTSLVSQPKPGTTEKEKVTVAFFGDGHLALQKPESWLDKLKAWLLALYQKAFALIERKK